MKFQTGEKFIQKATADLFEITGCFPKSCGVRLDTMADNYYRVTIDGVHLFLTEYSMDILLQKLTGEERKIEAFEVSEVPSVPYAPNKEFIAHLISGPKPIKPPEVILEEVHPSEIKLDAKELPEVQEEVLVEQLQEKPKKKGRPKKSV
jgi:hypothetical protein